MWKAFYKDMDYTELPIFALLLFFGVFLVVLVWVSVFRRAQDFDNLARMPLDEDVPIPSGGLGSAAGKGDTR